MTDAQIQAAIDRYDYFVTELYHERLNPDYEQSIDHRHGNDWLESEGWRRCCGSRRDFI